MKKNYDVTVYTMPACKACANLKAQLNKKGIPFEEKDLRDFNNMAKIRQNGIFIFEAPVLQVGESYYNSHEIGDLYQVFL